MKSYKYLSLCLLPLLCVPWVVGALYAGEYTLLDDLNLRQGPGSAYVSSRVVAHGQRVIELKHEGEWIKVRLLDSNAEGWVYGDSLAPVAQPVVISTNDQFAAQPIELQTNATKQATDSMVISASKVVSIDSNAAVNLAPIDQGQGVKGQSNAESVVSDQALLGPSKPEQQKSTMVSQQDSRLYRFNRKSTLRAGPAAKYDAVAWAGNGSNARMLERQGDWLRVQMQESKRIGWVFHSSLDDVKPAVTPEAAAVIAVAHLPVDTQLEASVAVLQTVMIRAEASALSEMLGWLGSGAHVSVVDQQGRWAKIRMPKSGRMGWVDRASLQGSDDVNPVKTTIATPPSSLSQTASSQSTPSQMPLSQAAPSQSVLPQSVLPQTDALPVVKGQGITKSSEPAQALLSPLKPEQQKTTMLSQPDSRLYRFNRKSTLRAGPASKYDAVGWAGNGSKAQMLERQGDWLRVQMQESKRIGWVFHSSLDGIKVAALPAASVAVVSSKHAIAPDVLETVVGNVVGKATPQLYFFKRTSDLRSGPGESYARVGWGGSNESAEEIAHQGNWKHVRMTISGKEGWVFNSYLERVTDSAAYDIVKPASAPVHSAVVAQIGSVYQVMRTEPLRSDAGDFSKLIGTVSKGDMVTWLDERDGWVKVSPRQLNSKAGWIQAKLLKQGDLRAVEHKKAIIDTENVVTYRDRISTGKTFNYSYAALEEALYRIPVEDIQIRINKDDLKALFLKRQYDKSSFDVKIKTGRHTLRGTVKVLGSSTRIFKKKSLLLKLDKESARWYGHRRIALRSMASDKGLMREWMVWKMMAAMGMKVPEVHFTRVSFNRGEKTGLYLSIEWMGPEFLAANGLDPRGEFYQPNDATHCGDLYSTENLQTCFDKITPQDVDYGHLTRMAKAVNAATNDNIDKVLASYFDVDSVINWITVNTLVTNGDSYNKNYWLYFHPDEKKWTVIPWDYNLTFGRTYDQYGSRGFRIFNDNFQYYYPPDVGAGNPIKDKALRNPKLRAQMETKIKHLIGMEPNGSEQTFGWFSPTVMHARIGNLAAVLGKEVYKDTFLAYGENDFTKTYESLMYFVTAHDYFLKTKLFGDFEWDPEPPNQGFVNLPLPDQLLGFGELEAGSESLHLIDRGWGYFVADLHLQQALESNAEFEVKVEGGITPKYLPTGQSARRCIERSWQLHIKTANVSIKANVMFEYLQENSRRSEVPPAIHEELLELWMLDGNHWKPVQTTGNEYANTLVAKGIHLESGHNYRFVACSPF